MKKIYKIARAELQTLFYSPVAWLILIIFAFQSSLTFTTSMEGWVRYYVMGYKAAGVSLDLFANQMRGLFFVAQSYLYLYIPLLTMGLMSRELSSGSIKLLYSSPLTNTQIILGKFLSMMIYGLMLIAILGVFVLTAAVTVEAFEWRAALVGLLGLYMLICAYASIGLFMSSLTSYQVIAALGTLAMLAVLNFVGGMWQDIAFVRDITYWLSISGRAGWFVYGMIVSEDVLYFLIVISLFLTLTIVRLQANRQKASWTVSWGKYVGVFVVAMMLGYITSRPQVKAFYDSTTTKMNTLTQNSQDVVKQLKGGLTITSYTNALDDQNLWVAIPRAVNADKARFDQYVRFKPDTKLKYVYYYDTLNNPGLEKRYPNMTDKERVAKITEAYDIKTKIFISPEKIRKQIDLSPEGNKFVRSVERESGEQTFLRIFDDMMVLPGETEITAALKRIAMKLPKVGFLRGHGERDNYNQGDRGYNRFAQDKPFRYSLINQGFDVDDVTLDGDVSEDINILVIADMREPLSESEKHYLDRYIIRGGNMLIASEPKRQDAMAPIVEPFGVSFTTGVLVYPSESFLANFIIARPTPESTGLFYTFANMAARQQVVTMPGTVGLEYTTDRGFSVTPLLVSDSLVWNEFETSNFIDEVPRPNPAIGEKQKPYTTALALSRKVGEKEQKIVILGDADCISNSEISMERRNISASNFTVITGSFFWMSDNEVPIDVRRPPLPDDMIYLDKESMGIVKLILMWVLPGILFVVAIVLWIRRKGR